MTLSAINGQNMNIIYNTIHYNTIQYSFYYKLTFTGDGSCLNPIDMTLSAINGQNMNIIYNTIQYNTIQYNTIQYNSSLFLTRYKIFRIQLV